MMHSGACLFYFLDSTLKYDFFGGLFTEGKMEMAGKPSTELSNDVDGYCWEICFVMLLS